MKLKRVWVMTIAKMLIMVIVPISIISVVNLLMVVNTGESYPMALLAIYIISLMGADECAKEVLK